MHHNLEGKNHEITFVFSLSHCVVRPQYLMKKKVFAISRESRMMGKMVGWLPHSQHTIQGKDEQKGISDMHSLSVCVSYKYLF